MTKAEFEKLSSDEQQAAILAIQTPATRAMLSQSKAEREAYWASLIPDHIAVPNAKTMEERVGARPISFEESQREERLRRKRGHIMEEMRLTWFEAQGVTAEQLAKAPEHMRLDKKGSVDEAKRERGIAAFMRTTAQHLWGSIKAAFHQVMDDHRIYEKVKNEN